MQNIWSRDELLIAFNLYCKIPFTKINSRYKPVMDVANIIGRSNNALAMKLANFARLDPALQARGIKGLRGGSKSEEIIWNEFSEDWAALSYESELLLAKLGKNNLVREFDLNRLGLSKEATVKVRINQHFFRNAVLSSYNNQCCITGICIPEILIASHIIPWAIDENNRVNPQNGVCLNALHDKAFDKGLISITNDFKIIVSEKILKLKGNQDLDIITKFNGKEIKKPQKFLPKEEFLDYHFNNIFQK